MFSSVFIERPRLAMVVAIVITLVGAIAITAIPVAQYPNITPPVVQVQATYPGADAETIAETVAAPIEEQVNGVENMIYMSSTSASAGTYTLSVSFEIGTDPDIAQVNVQNRLQAALPLLPASVTALGVTVTTQQPSFLLIVNIFSPNGTYDALFLSNFTSINVKDPVARVQGVGSASILGELDYSMRIWMDPIRMAALSISPQDVYNAVSEQNIQAAVGQIGAPPIANQQVLQYNITAQGRLVSTDQFGNIVVRTNSDGGIVRIRDIARIELGAQTYAATSQLNGKPAATLAIYQSANANALGVAQGVRDELERLKSRFPDDVDYMVTYDSTAFVTATIHEIIMTLVLTGFIVLVVVFIFLQDLRATLIPALTIPVSLIGTFAILLALGFSANTITLLAMVLAIGLVVDDAIVVVENIHRHIEEGMKPLQASIVGMREIFTAVVAMTITLAAVYAPIGFTEGLTGALFREFAFTLAGAVVISGFVAVTLAPMMSSRLLSAHGGGRLQHIIDRVFDRLSFWYGRRLAATLDYRPVTLMIVAAIMGTSVYLVTKTSGELAPEEDQGALFSIVNGPNYATSDYVKLYTDQIDGTTGNFPELEARFQIAGAPTSSQAFAIWVLKPWDQRERGQAAIQQELQGKLAGIAGVEAFVFAPPSLPGAGGGLPIEFVVQSTASVDKVYEVAEEIKQRAMASGRFIVVQSSLAYDTPSARVTIDRARAAALGVPISEIGTTLGALVGGASVSKFDRDSRSYDVIPQVPQKYRLNPEQLGTFYVRSAGGAMVPLSSVVTIETSGAPPALEQFNQLNSATISAMPFPGVTSGDGLQTIRDIAAEVMPDGFFENFAGQSRLEVRQGNAIAIAFALAVVVIYLVLAAQFESFRDPLIIMMSVPLSIFGALVPLNLGLGTLNIYTQVGLITLVGLITKHGILMVSFANQRRAQSALSRREAVVEAARVRLRPILMTTAAMVLGVIPLILSTGAGAQARYSIGLVIAAGMSVGTLFTLFVVPMFYTYIARAEIEPAAEERHAPEGHGTIPA